MVELIVLEGVMELVVLDCIDVLHAPPYRSDEECDGEPVEHGDVVQQGARPVASEDGRGSMDSRCEV